MVVHILPRLTSMIKKLTYIHVNIFFSAQFKNVYEKKTKLENSPGTSQDTSKLQNGNFCPGNLFETCPFKDLTKPHKQHHKLFCCCQVSMTLQDRRDYTMRRDPKYAAVHQTAKVDPPPLTKDFLLSQWKDKTMHTCRVCGGSSFVGWRLLYSHLANVHGDKVTGTWACTAPACKMKTISEAHRDAHLENCSFITSTRAQAKKLGMVWFNDKSIFIYHKHLIFCFCC